MKYSGKLEPDTWWSISTLVLVFLPWIFTILMSCRSEKSDMTSKFSAKVCDINIKLSFDLQILINDFVHFQKYDESKILRIWRTLNGLPVFIQQFPIVILVVNIFYCLVLIKVNSRIEKIRDDEGEFAETVIHKYFVKENVVKDEKHNHFNVFKNETKQNFRKTLKGNSKNLATLTGQQTAIISEATLSKKAEVYLEASPQAILQLYIIAITGAVSTSQVVTIVVSLFVTTFGTMTTFLKEPTKVSFLIDKHIHKGPCPCMISNTYICK